MGDILKRSNVFIGEIKNIVLTCLRLETRSNYHYFWSFIMHSKSSSNFFCCPGALLLHFILREQDILFIWVIHPWRNFWKEAIFSQLRPKLVLFCLRLGTRSNIHYFWSFIMHSKSSSNFFCCPGALLLHFILREQDILFIWVIHPWRNFWKEAIFSQLRPKLVLFCLRLETRSNIYYFWSSNMHSLCASNFFLRRWCTFTPFYSKRARYSVHLKKVVLTCLRLETRSNIHYFWSFIMHSLSSSTFLLRPGAIVLRFTLYESKIFCSSQWIIRGWCFKKKQIVHRLDQKSGFNLSTLRNTFQHSLLLKFRHAIRSLSIFFLRPWCTSTPF